MLHGLSAGIFGGNLRRVRGRLARALEALAPRRRPRDRIALSVGDRDHRIVEGGIHMRRTRGDVLALAPAQARRCCRRSRHLMLSSFEFDPWDLFLFSGNGPGRSLSRPRICMGALSPHRQSLAVAQAAIAAEIH